MTQRILKILFVIAFLMLFFSCEKPDTPEPSRNRGPSANVLIYTSDVTHHHWVYDLGLTIKNHRLPVYQNSPECNRPPTVFEAISLPVGNSYDVVVRNADYPNVIYKTLILRIYSDTCQAIDVY